MTVKMLLSEIDPLYIYFGNGFLSQTKGFLIIPVSVCLKVLFCSSL